MSLKLVHKLLLALFFTTAATLVLMVLIARAGIDRGFRDYIEQQETAWLGNLATSLAEWYESNGDWKRLQNDPRQFARLVRANGPLDLQSTPQAPPPAVLQERRERFAQQRPGGTPPLPRVALLDAEKRPVIGAPLRQLDADRLVPVQVAGETVGWLGRARAGRTPAPQETAFLKRQGRFLLMGFTAALVLAGLMAWWLSRQLGQPVTRVAEGIRALAAGRYDVEVERRGGDEIDALGQDVNRLARKLTDNEQARQRWMAI